MAPGIELGLLEQELFVKTIGAGDLVLCGGGSIKERRLSVDTAPGHLFAIDIGDKGVIVANAKLQPGLGELLGNIEFYADIESQVVVGHVSDDSGVIFISVAEAARTAFPAGILGVEINLVPVRWRCRNTPEEPPGVAFTDQSRLSLDFRGRKEQQCAERQNIGE